MVDGQDDSDLDRTFMERAVEEARKSRTEAGHVPLKVGAVVVKDGKELVVAYRGEISEGDHAEFTALEKKLAEVEIAGATVYTALEPCTTRNHPKVPTEPAGGGGSFNPEPAATAKGKDTETGRSDGWITVNGTHILVTEAQTAAEAIAAHAAKHGNTANESSADAKKYPHLAHLLNGSKVESADNSKADAKQKCQDLRAKGVYASAIKDPKGPRGKQYLVVVPKDHGRSAAETARAAELLTLAPEFEARVRAETNVQNAS